MAVVICNLQETLVCFNVSILADTKEENLVDITLNHITKILQEFLCGIFIIGVLIFTDNCLDMSVVTKNLEQRIKELVSHLSFIEKRNVR